MRHRIALLYVAGVSSLLMTAVGCGSSSGGGGSPGSEDAEVDAAGGSSGGSSSGGTSSSGSSSGGSSSDGTVEPTDGGSHDATVPEGDGATEGGVLPSYCGAWTSISGATSAYVSSTVTLHAVATGSSPDNLGYTWSQSTADGGTIGVFGETQDEAAGANEAVSFLCTSAGTATITLTVDQGPLPDGGSCPAAMTTTTTTVTCNAYPANQVESAWVELGSTGSSATDGGIAGSNVVIARVVTGDATCPTITLNASGTPTPMNQRVAAGTIPLRVTTSTSEGAQYSKPSVFPVQTCELALPSGTTSAVVNAALPGSSTQGITLPLPKANAQTIVVIGDTGCRLQYSAPTVEADGGILVNSQYQDCLNSSASDVNAYTFSTTATLAAAMHPDLVIHVGDYEYRDNQCPPDQAGCAGAPWGYGWDAWQADFFAPAQPLLAAAPWIVNRGNHESCTRSGQGWYRFLDTNGYDTIPNKDCNSQGAVIAADAGGGFVNDNLGGYNTPYGVQARSDTQVMVFDTSNIAKAAITPTGSNGFMYGSYASELQEMAVLPQGGWFNIWTNHHPLVGFQEAPPVNSPGIALLSVMNNVYPDTLFPPGTNMALHGHVHLFEAIDYTATATDAGVPNNYPATFVSGNAGTLLDTDLPTPLPSGTTPDPTALVPPVVENIAHSPDFGFIVMTYQAADAGSQAAWLITEYTQTNPPTVRTQCTATIGGQTTCTNWGDLTP